VVTAGAGLYEGRAGPYRRGFLEWIFSGPATLRLSGEVWDTPLGVVYAGNVGLHVSLWGRWSARADGGRGVPDPLVRAPQGLQGGGFLGLRILDMNPMGPGSTTVRVVESSESGSTVMFTLPRSVGEAVSVLGGFSDWEARPLLLEDGRWTTTLRIPPGTHHFGFEVDGRWYLPGDAPGRVADEWGQENGTLVIAGSHDVTEGRP
ncbi:MAG: glycogen-binding domain-containing protein, partial [Gemmatimonadota bacterium]|nr:glycogen-binding domain-containing protein [Gemmatimonadota bacterium]